MPPPEHPQQLPKGYTITLEPKQDDNEAPKGGTGSQVLPVGTAGGGKDGPMDGMQYLYMVRMEARSCPKVKRAEGWPIEQEREKFSNLSSASEQEEAIEEGQVQQTTWYDGFVKQFQQLRLTYRNSPPEPQIPDTYLPFPPLDWNSWLYGLGGVSEIDPAAVPFIGVQALASNIIKEPLPGLLSSMDQPTMFSLLSHFKDSIRLNLEEHIAVVSCIQEPSTTTAFLPPRLRKAAASKTKSRINTYSPNRVVPEVELLPHLSARWMFALLVAIEDVLTSDDICTLREIARLAIDLAKWRNKRISHLEKEKIPEFYLEERASCSILVCAVGGGWGQSDLWQEAKGVFSTDGDITNV